MFIYLGFHLVGAYGVNLANFGAAGDTLAQHHIQQAQFTVDGGFHNEVALALADHLHIQQHVVQALFHTVNLGTAVQAVLLASLTDKLIFLQGQAVILLGLQIIFLGDEFVLIERFLLLIGTLEAVDLYAILQYILAHIQLLLFHLDLGIAENVFLLSQFGL